MNSERTDPLETAPVGSPGDVPAMWGGLDPTIMHLERCRCDMRAIARATASPLPARALRPLPFRTGLHCGPFE